MESTEQMVKELLRIFLHQDTVRKIASEDDLIKVYWVGDDLVRVDIKVKKR